MRPHIPIHVLAIALAVAVLLPGRAAAQLNDTGQTQCADSNGAVVDCADDGGTHPGQDGHFGRDARAASSRLTKRCGGAAGFDFCALDASGAFTAAGDAQCVADQTTGLIWSTQTLDARAWADANAVGTGYVRCAIGAGWRLPTRRELLSIVDHGTVGPAIDADAFPGTISAAYWSADAYAPDPGQAWVVDFSDGDTAHAAQGQAHLARLVVPAVNQPPRITLGADIEVPREDRPAPLSFPGWATGIAPGPPRESGQHLTATLRLLPVTGQKALQFDTPPSLDVETGTLSFTIKHTIYPGTDPYNPDPDPDDHSFDMWVSSAGLARVEVTLKDDGGTARGGVDTTVAGVFTIFLDPAPVARDITIKHPWKAAAIPVTHGAFDADTDPQSSYIWPTYAWWWPQVRIVTWPTKGVLTDYVSRPADADAGAGTQMSVSKSAAKLSGPVTAELACTYDGVDQFWLFMFPTTPERHDYNGLSYNYNNTIVYVPLSSTWTGSDTYTYCVVDPDGNVSNIASVSIEIFEVRP